MTSKPPRDPAEITAERLAGRQAKLIAALQHAYGYVPDDVRLAVVAAVQGAEGDGEDHAYLRRTVRHEPPDPDSVKTPPPDDPEQRARAWERAFESTGAHGSECQCHLCKTPARGARRDGRRE